ncbi:hypothetical protein OAR04_04430 [Flavobacteriales bacterium]|nr:hypothetical protein [Flavobacteriales bacterium]
MKLKKNKKILVSENNKKSIIRVTSKNIYFNNKVIEEFHDFNDIHKIIGIPDKEKTFGRKNATWIYSKLGFDIDLTNYAGKEGVWSQIGIEFSNFHFSKSHFSLSPQEILDSNPFLGKLILYETEFNNLSTEKDFNKIENQFDKSIQIQVSNRKRYFNEGVSIEPIFDENTQMLRTCIIRNCGINYLKEKEKKNTKSTEDFCAKHGINEKEYYQVLDDIKDEKIQEIEGKKSENKKDEFVFSENKVLFEAEIQHKLAGKKMDDYAFEESWSENILFTEKISNTFNNNFNRKIWFNNNYFNTDLDANEGHRKYIIDNEECIVGTYIRVSKESNEILYNYPAKEKYKKTIVLEFLYLINLLDANSSDSGSVKFQKMSVIEISEIIFESNRALKFISENNISIWLTNTGDHYLINLYPPGSVFNGLTCEKEGSWILKL